MHASNETFFILVKIKAGTSDYILFLFYFLFMDSLEMQCVRRACM